MQRLFWSAAAMCTVVVNAYFAGFQNAKKSTYLAQLRSSATGTRICQGVLVAPDFALFTRSCVEDYDKADKVVVGATRIDGGLDDGEWTPVLNKYYSVNRSLDFAMVRLAQPSKVPPVRILWDDVDPGKLVWLRGWSWFPFNNGNTLSETTVQLLSNDQCQAKLNRPIYAYQGCSNNDNIEMCVWYIFGSLMIEIDGSDFTLGTLVLYNCVDAPTLQIFNRISAGRSFIEPFLCNGT
ncbi:hypothetical protein AaE_002254 [Aphanomyces astaci]|uniref:Peptidase S1 domain-containing protein n=1 Tax=Aphanomyces astaci TaxID=112090 RepID=A0A6A5AUW4_APHAT|nr:hypothetical protein AaE_002254 [Aphanomyces astaci]